VFRQGAFAETGAGAVSLNVDGNTTGSALGIVGAEVAYGLPVGFSAPLQLSARVGWARELADTRRTATAFFAGVPGTSFTVDGASVPRDSALFGLGMTLAMPSFNLFVRYDGSAGGGAMIQGGSAGVRLVF
jgi:uncharacterized protein with beta-barrel porin domain